MITVASRTLRSSPYRDASQTWNFIVDLLCPAGENKARSELLAVVGIAAAVIADGAPKSSPIVVTSQGPRTRIYCLYDEDAVLGADANEDTLGFNALKGDWRVSLPCSEDDLLWVQTALRKLTASVTARALDDAVVASELNADVPKPLTIDLKGFLGS